MLLQDLIDDWDASGEGANLYSMMRDLFPICRSITGEGLRESLEKLRPQTKMSLHEIPSGTKVLDWTVPKEWNVRDAYIKNSRGDRILDFQKSNLHVVSYSTPIRATLPLSELKKHIHTLPEYPEWIPYRTSYYHPDWGFCMSHREFLDMNEPEYEVCIDSTLEPGYMTIGELKMQGQTEKEVLISCHSCHPSLCNDNLSGMTVGAMLARKLAAVSDLRFSYRFLWMPGTIGAITWLALNEQIIPKIRHGLVLSCLGDSGPFSYKQSRRGSADVDLAVESVLRHSGHNYQILEYAPLGYDERQYCSPGFNLPVGCFMRTPNGKYPEYHTSADNMDFVSKDALAESLFHLLQVISVLEHNRRYLSQNTKGEPQLGRRGLYQQTGGKPTQPREEEAMLWVLSYSDGDHSLLDICRRSHMPFYDIYVAAEHLEKHRLLRKIG